MGGNDVKDDKAVLVDYITRNKDTLAKFGVDLQQKVHEFKMFECSYNAKTDAWLEYKGVHVNTDMGSKIIKVEKGPFRILKDGQGGVQKGDVLVGLDDWVWGNDKKMPPATRKQVEEFLQRRRASANPVMRLRLERRLNGVDENTVVAEKNELQKIKGLIDHLASELGVKYQVKWPI